MLEILGLKDQTSSEKKAATIAIDTIAQLRSITNNVPDTFEDLIVRFLNSIAKGFVLVDIVADCYRDTSIKTAGRQTRGNYSKILISSIKSKVPRDITKFYSCTENKNQLIKLLFAYVKEN